MSKTFLADFCPQVIETYQAYSPITVAPCDVHLKPKQQILSFRFHIRDARLEDTLCFKLHPDEISVELSLGYYVLPQCSFDKYGRRWFYIDRFSYRVSQPTKTKIETLASKLYQLAQQNQPQLRFLLSSERLMSGGKASRG